MAKCIECKTDGHKTLIDYKEEGVCGGSDCYKVHIIKDDGNKPSPTGFCFDCFRMIFEKKVFINSEKE